MIFKQLITNLGIHCALKMSDCQEFLRLHVPSKNEPPKFYPREHPKKNMSGNPGILGIFSIAQSHIIHHAILIIT